jgi:hypothetical protein
MHKFLIYTSFILLISTHVSAQETTLRGVVRDTTDHQNMVFTTVSLLHAKDSVLYRFTRTADKGEFSFSNLLAGTYILLITRYSYADFRDSITIQAGEVKDMGFIEMVTKAHLLEDVVVRQKIAAMRMRGDTLEYRADSFSVREGATVEEMLKILPGIQVDKAGNITAQGERVQKVLVDGEEFFGNDPTVATQNLQADAVEKVQVFDKKSEQSEFTGIDDGERTKTINLTLKEDKKKGYFGKIEAGVGTSNTWNNTGMINDFKSKRKLSAYGLMSSTGKTGLNWEENNQYGGGSVPEMDEDFGGFFFFSGNDDELSSDQYYGEGIPKSWGGGLNYSNKFNEEKNILNGSYRFNKISSTGRGNTLVQSVLPDSAFFNQDQGYTFNSRQRHSVNGTYDWIVDSSFDVKIKANGYLGANNTVSNYKSNALDEAKSPINAGERNINNDGKNNNVNASLTLRKKFSKQGRTLSLNLNETISQNNSKGKLFAANLFYNKGLLIGIDTTDQLKDNETKIAAFTSKLVYTEPIAKKLFAEINYGYKNYRSDAQRLSFDRGSNGEFEELNDTFSSHYKFNADAHASGLGFKYNGKKITVSVGTDISFINFDQVDLLNDSVFARQYTNLFPRAAFTYKFSSTSRMNLRYNGSTNQPTIQQIQPLADNANPLSITVGNPLLRQEFRHTVNFNYNNFKVLTNSGVWLYGNFTVTEDAIVSNQTVDSNGRMLYQYINANGNFNGFAGVGLFRMLKKIDANLNLGINTNISRYNTFINNIRNQTDNYSIGINGGISKATEKKYNFSYYGAVDYNYSVSSINRNVTNSYITQNHSLNLTIYLPWKMEINGVLEANLRQRTSLFDQNNNVYLLNGYIGRKMLKNEKAIIKLSVYDLLNQNKGYQRFINTSIIQEKNYQVLTQYFMLSFIWNFSKSASEIPGGKQIIITK